jgi:hypothetical protein
MSAFDPVQSFISIRSFGCSLIALLGIYGCAGERPMVRPLANETRAVDSVTDVAKTLVVKNGMVFYDRPFSYSHGIRFPEGTYTLEAEDTSQWDFRAPALMEFREFDNGKITSSRSAPGGLMLAKSKFNIALPAGGYVDGDAGKKILVWILAGDFVRLEGREWSKTF